MLTKLCKYELRSMSRTLLPIYLAVIIISVINAISFSITLNPATTYNESGWVMGLIQLFCTMLYMGVIAALFVMTFIMILQRFYKGLLGNEGYLMFTLPVRPWQLITSKGLVALIMMFLSTLTGIISVAILGTGMAGLGWIAEVFNLDVWIRIFQELSTKVPQWPLYLFELILLGIVSTLASLYQLYCSMAIGHVAKKHRIILSIAAFIGINIVLSFVSIFIISAGGATDFTSFAVSPYMNNPVSVNYHILLVSSLLYNLALVIIFFFVTNRILTKRLNLE